MTSETMRAVDAVKFIATHLRTEDDYAEVTKRIRIARYYNYRIRRGTSLGTQQLVWSVVAGSSTAA